MFNYMPYGKWLSVIKKSYFLNGFMVKIWAPSVTYTAFKLNGTFEVFSSKYSFTVTHLPGDDEASIMQCSLKAAFLLHTVLPNVIGELYTFMVYPCPNRFVCFWVGSTSWWDLWSLFKRTLVRHLRNETWKCRKLIGIGSSVYLVGIYWGSLSFHGKFKYFRIPLPAHVIWGSR